MFDAVVSGFNGFGQLNGFASDGVDGDQMWFKRENIRLLAATWSHVIIVSGESQDIEIWGFVGDEPKQKMILQDKPFNEDLIQIACTREKMFAVTTSGDLWQLVHKTKVWRNLRHAICENSQDGSEVNLAQVQKIAVGETMTVALTSSGKAHRLPGEEITLPDGCGPVVDVACGKEHCLLLTRRKRLFALGSSLRGQLGCGGLDSSSDPVEVDALSGMNIASIAAGGFHSAVVTDDGDLYTWGWNKQGQLGHPILSDSTPDGVLVLPEPRVVDFKTQREVIVKKVACGASHTIATLADETVWGCGWNKWKQLGKNQPRRSASLFELGVRVPRDVNSSDVLCSPWNSFVFWKKICVLDRPVWNGYAVRKDVLIKSHPVFIPKCDICGVVVKMITTISTKKS